LVGEPGQTFDDTADLSEFSEDPDTTGLVDSIWQDGDGVEAQLDTAGFGGGRACPLLTLTVPAFIGVPNWTPACNILAWLGNLFFAIAVLWGLRIIWEK